MWSYGFFNSVNGDRLYSAESMNKIFEGLITDGVYESVGNKLAVEPNSGMVIQINTGKGWFGERWVNNDSAYLITLEASDVTLSRYAAICVKVNSSDSVRSAEPFVKYSAFATNPTKPVMTRNDTEKEYCLAYVLIKAGATSISASDIEDTRSDASLCGWVTGLVEQLDASTLYTQFTALFNDWFSSLQDRVNENTETMLVNALPESVTALIPVDRWVASGNLYYQQIEIAGMNSTKSVIVQGGESTLDAYNEHGITCIGQGTNALSFTAETLPTTNIYVNVLQMGV